ncbi:endonuclease/exonuclease/phosphatase family protein [Tessaracoccus caeni]|uniref:endonuclease/exonuclease/phosphatase family protein n=1 Tax=Tessaracoccus caeni TaxID=3031239 RepID=UPI0023DAF188|nr:endonuclease/exonuclease/phosphatase family protein [Tessaracoccus caeni]MDF1488287.1 endonuclease/exonuclease/phosphatase family protein [Tessaracoccus caeni]
MRVLKVIGWILLILGALSTSALVLLELLPIVQTWATVLLYFSTFIPMMWIPAVVAIVGLAVVLKGRWKFAAAVLALVALLVWGLPVMPRNQGVVLNVEAFPRDLGVVSANARYGGADVEQILAEAGDQVQVLAFQEYTPEFDERLREAGAFDDFPYHVGEARTSAGGTVLLSRVPVEIVAEAEGLPFLNFVAKLTVDGRDWYVGNIHSTGPHFGAREWAEDGDAIVEMVRPYLDEAVVLVGDFNAIEEHYTLRRLAEAGFRNAMDYEPFYGGLERWQPTWRMGWVVPPFARIDHVYVGNGAAADVPYHFEVDGTDHKAIRAYFYGNR